MGLFGPSREEREFKETRAKTFHKFQSLIEQFHPEWSLTHGDSVTLHATCTHGQETLEFEINWRRGSITDAGAFRPGNFVNFSVRSPAVDVFVVGDWWNTGDHSFAWNQTAVDWLADYTRNSAPVIELTERKLKLKRSLGL
jgi:hypothetical protein